MTKSKPSEGHPAELDWPEPLVIDIVCERYPDIAPRSERLALARLQAQALREAYLGRDRRAAAARVDLIAFCAARGIASERIARVDLAVFWELEQIAGTRFRTSPRQRAEIGRRLEAAMETVRAQAPRSGAPAAIGAAVRRPLAATG